MREAAVERDWWRRAVVYQIYPRSFADGNGDGIGDLDGILSRVGYLAELGIDAVWLSPFYPSALADGGYDVDDYRDIDPVIGTLAQFGSLVDALHAHGIKVIVDIVPNHSSNRHQWFRDAVAASPGSPERDRYIFRDGTGDEPPADWRSFFGGPAWTRVPDGQWYLHLFTPEQPDWNWSNPDVRADFLRTLRFWGDHGVDGFRIDVANLLAKSLPAEGALPSWASLTQQAYPPGQHPLWDRDELDDIYTSWRALFNQYTPPLTAVAEAWVDADRRVRYARADGLGQAFNFDLLQASWEAASFRKIIETNVELARENDSSSTWVLSNHDVVRHATRLGLARARAATLLALALPGSMYLYQGEELGLPEAADIPDARRQDPVFFRSGGASTGRDGCRVPLPWTADGVAFGFGDAAPHLPQPASFASYAMSVQSADGDSTLTLYRRALALRRAAAASGDGFSWMFAVDDDEVVAFKRDGGWGCVTNFGPAAVRLPAGTVLLTSSALDEDGYLPADTTAWIQLRP